MLLLLLLAPPAFAYNEAIHVLITRTALPDARMLEPATQQDLDAFRALFWRNGMKTPDFARRYPTVESFDAWAFKEFLMLDPAARVHGIDQYDEPGRGAEWSALAAEQLAQIEDRQHPAAPVRDAGQPVGRARQPRDGGHPAHLSNRRENTSGIAEKKSRKDQIACERRGHCGALVIRR